MPMGDSETLQKLEGLGTEVKGSGCPFIILLTLSSPAPAFGDRFGVLFLVAHFDVEIETCFRGPQSNYDMPRENANSSPLMSDDLVNSERV